MMCGRTTLRFTWVELSTVTRCTSNIGAPILGRCNLTLTQTGRVARVTADGGRGSQYHTRCSARAWNDRGA